MINYQPLLLGTVDYKHLYLTIISCQWGSYGLSWQSIDLQFGGQWFWVSHFSSLDVPRNSRVSGKNRPTVANPSKSLILTRCRVSTCVYMRIRFYLHANKYIQCLSMCTSAMEKVCGLFDDMLYFSEVCAWPENCSGWILQRRPRTPKLSLAPDKNALGSHFVQKKGGWDQRWPTMTISQLCASVSLMFIHTHTHRLGNSSRQAHIAKGHAFAQLQDTQRDQLLLLVGSLIIEHCQTWIAHYQPLTSHRLTIVASYWLIIISHYWPFGSPIDHLAAH